VPGIAVLLQLMHDIIGNSVIAGYCVETPWHTQGQKPESASGEARGGGGLGTLGVMREALILAAAIFLLAIITAAVLAHFVVP
jgi:hypothetical protein